MESLNKKELGESLKISMILKVLVAILAYKKAKTKDFEHGSLIDSCRFYSYLIDVEAEKIRPYVSYIKFFYGLNKSSFKAGKYFDNLIKKTELFTSIQLIEVINSYKNYK